MLSRAVLSIPAGTPNGFDVVRHDGSTYLRVLAHGVAVYAVPQTAAELRQLAAAILNAADIIDRR
ncbi:MAG TPA: hypothetical protein VIQ30_12750 [Pseudonocardia sp.]